MIKQILDKNEKLLWHGKPNFRVFVVRNIQLSFFTSALLTFFLGVLIFMVLGVVSITNLISDSESPPDDPFESIAVLDNLDYIIILTFLVIELFVVLYILLSHSQIEYGITTKRVILSSGIIGRDFNSIDYDKIVDISVNVGIIDKLLGSSSGSIRVFAGEIQIAAPPGHHQMSVPKANLLADIDDAYKVYKLLKNTSHDIKTDIEYPNKLRPERNPGYQMEYKGVDK